MKRTLIRVTEDHIAKGNHSSDTCPLALAIEDATGRHNSVVCDVYFFTRTTGTIHGFHLGSCPIVNLSRRALRWRRAFDRQEPVKPFNFYLMVPQ